MTRESNEGRGMDKERQRIAEEIAVKTTWGPIEVYRLLWKLADDRAATEREIARREAAGLGPDAD